MPDQIKPCCGTSEAAYCHWGCPATPIWAATVEAVRPPDLGYALWAMRGIPLHVINRPDITLRINPEDASWEISNA